MVEGPERERKYIYLFANETLAQRSKDGEKPRGFDCWVKGKLLALFPYTKHYTLPPREGVRPSTSPQAAGMTQVLRKTSE